MLITELTRRLGISHPVIQAGMGDGAGPLLASAVSNAGALGSIGTFGQPPKMVREAIAQCRDKTSAPWAVNIVTFASAPNSAEALAAAIDERVPVITLSFGDPVSALRRCQEAGIPAIVQVQDFSTAVAVLAEGPLAIIVQGHEAGGHAGGRGTMSFAAQVLEAAGDVPVVIAGGVGNGRGLAAALAMGAAGVVMGTRFKATDEFTAMPALKQAIAASDGSNTSAAAVFDAVSAIDWPTGIVGRAMNNRFSGEWRGREDELRAKSAAMPLFALHRELASDPETAINWAGESSGLIDAILPAATVVENTVAQAEALLRQASLVVR